MSGATGWDGGHFVYSTSLSEFGYRKVDFCEGLRSECNHQVLVCTNL